MDLSHIQLMLIFTMADWADQLYSWQDKLFEHDEGTLKYEGSNPFTLWPGDGRPGLWMNRLSEFGILARRCAEKGAPHSLPKGISAFFSRIPLTHFFAVFDNCSATVSASDERTARDLYWNVTTTMTEPASHDNAMVDLEASIALNPFMAESRLLLAQILATRAQWPQALESAQAALRLLLDWGVAYDKRVPWQGWVAWCRVVLRCVRQEAWPESAFGVINLGMVEREMLN